MFHSSFVQTAIMRINILEGFNMKNLRLKIFTLTLIVWQLLFSGTSYAEEEGNNLSDVWVMTPIAGKNAEFEKAFVEHLKFRISKGDSRNWSVYTPVIADGFNQYVVRFCCTTYADMDTYQKWDSDNKIAENWNSTAGQYVAEYQHYLGETDLENSNWNVEGKNLQFFAVTEYHAKMGKGQSIEAGKKLLSENAKAMKWPYNWSWQWQVGGEGHLSLVIPYENYAQMAPPEKSFAKALTEHMGDKNKVAEVMSSWSDNFHHTTYSVWRIRPDLMTKPSK